ncbi:hypothetical protein L0F63_004058, partial [Massospora cicadina]
MVFKLVEKLISPPLGATPYSCVLRDWERPKLRSTKRRKLETSSAYETWLVPECTLWVCDPDGTSAYHSSIIFLSDEEKRQHRDLSFLCSVECCRKGKVTRSSIPGEFSIRIREVGAIPTTVVNGRRLEIGETMVCLPSDVIVFGRTPSLPGVEFTLLEIPLKICGSLKNPARGKKTSADSLKSLGIDFSVEWAPDCTHLLMDKFRVTSKLFQCLALRKPVVNHLWLDKLVDLFLSAKGALLPSLEDHLPSLASSAPSNKISISDAKVLLPNEGRSSLFDGSFGLTCPGSEAELIRDLVTSGGGELSVIPKELVNGTKGGKQGKLPIFYEPSRAETWGSLAELKHSSANLQAAWKCIPMVELCQRIIYINKLTASPKPPQTDLGMPLQGSNCRQAMCLNEGMIFAPRNVKPHPDGGPAAPLEPTQPSPARCRLKSAQLVIPQPRVTGQGNCKAFRKAGSGLAPTLIPKLIPLVPLHKIRTSKVAARAVDPFDTMDG